MTFHFPLPFYFLLSLTCSPSRSLHWFYQALCYGWVTHVGVGEATSSTDPDLDPIFWMYSRDCSGTQHQKTCCDYCRLHLLLFSYLRDLSFCHRRKMNGSTWFSLHNAMLVATQLLRLHWEIKHWLSDSVLWCLPRHWRWLLMGYRWNSLSSGCFSENLCKFNFIQIRFYFLVAFCR